MNFSSDYNLFDFHKFIDCMNFQLVVIIISSLFPIKRGLVWSKAQRKIWQNFMT